MTIGDIIKAARKKAGYTQKELARILGVTPQMISAYEKNLRNPKYTTLTSILKTLNVPDSLIEGLIFSEITIDDVYDSINNCHALNSESLNSESLNSKDNDYIEIITLNIQQLNADGKKEAVKRVEELTYIPKYTEPDNK